MNKNIAMLSALYDNTTQRIQNIMGNKRVNFNDPRLKQEVEWLATISQTLATVLQIEKLRQPSSQAANEVTLPEEKDTPDIAPPTTPNNPQFPRNQDFTGFASPGGWKP